MIKRKPQINFQVEEPMKILYDEAKLSGHRATLLCAAGLLLMVEEPELRTRALNRLREWEAEYDAASPEEIRVFVQGAQGALRRGARGNRRGRKAPPSRKAARRAPGG